jgi:hypothetical protein
VVKPQAGQRFARSPGIASVAVPQRPQKTVIAAPLDDLHRTPGQANRSSPIRL